MAAPHIMIKPTEVEGRAPRRPPISPSLGWELLGWAGLAFFIVGGLDLLMGWVPLRLGNPEWEFATVSRTFDNLPITLLGLTMLLASASARGIPWAMRATGLVALVLALFLGLGLVVYALDLPLAFRVVTAPEPRAGLKRATLKAIVQGTLYPTVLVAIGLKGIRSTLRARARLS